ncbi:MAG: type IX secretion system membrane protein PorP/SprF [Saprospiraceae bacterium]|nr:type IX secretion system membrane protein PorP/SprF [Saprospiraceae bacterium]
MHPFYTKLITFGILLGLASGQAFAQQEPQYTQFVFNKLAYNPGYAGSFVSPTLSAIYRNQWMGIDGAPNTQILSYNQPWLNDRMGFGVNLTRNSIGITRTMTLDIVYCYRIKMRRGYLGLGVQPSLRNLYQNWSDDRLYSPTPAGTDGAIPIEARNKFVMNFGAGFYYSADKWYAGFALPRFFKNSIDFAEYGGILSREERHFNIMTGATLEANENLKFTPELLVKLVVHAPLEIELNLSALLKDKFYGGVSYRAGGDTNGAGESVAVMAGLQATKNLFFCVSYDIGLTRLRRFSNGSVEATARWWFNPPEGSTIDAGNDFRN